MWLSLLASPCYALSQAYPNPTLEATDGKSYRLDWCRSWENQCGCVAALAFCKEQGFAYVQSFVMDPRVDLKQISTVIVDQRGTLCPGLSPGHGCDSFKEIVCSDRVVKNDANSCNAPAQPGHLAQPLLKPLLLPAEPPLSVQPRF